jgi:hypothetical protein
MAAIDTLIGAGLAPSPYSEMRDALKSANSDIATLKRALRRSMRALDDWTHEFAPEFCDLARVSATRKRIMENGTLYYIATVQERNCSALKATKRLHE